MQNYYASMKNLWAEGGGWAGSYYGVFSSIINKNKFKYCAEVGIGYGFHAKEVLDNTNLEKLYLIDPMVYYNDAFADNIINNGGFELLVTEIKSNLSQYQDKYVWFRQPSTTITNDQVPDESLDAVFIDGDHSYDAVKADLEFWWKKVKHGGCILGDDYAVHPPTKQAVDDFAMNHELKLEFLYKENTQYPIYKFIKT